MYKTVKKDLSLKCHLVMVSALVSLLKGGGGVDEGERGDLVG